MISLFNYLLISNIFTSGIILFKTRFEFYVGYIFMILFLIYYFIVYRKPYISKTFLYVLTSILLLSFMNVWLGYNSASMLLKQFIAFIFNCLVYYLLIKVNKSDINKLFRIYLKLAVIMALIGIFQEISFLAGFKYGYDYSYLIHKMQQSSPVWGMLRVTSLLPEPSHFGAAMAPAIFVAVLTMIKGECYFISRKAAILIIISVLLSFSLVAYIGIISALVMIILNYQRAKFITVCTIILVSFTYISYRYLPNIKERVDDTLAVINHKIPLKYANVSTFTFYCNTFIAYKSLKNNPVLGSGLGSHQLSYQRYISQIVEPDSPAWVYALLNKEDAGSLFVRLISETGLLGITAFLCFLFRFYVSRKRDGHLWVISNAILCLVILNLLRMGNYFYSGFILFIWLYYFAGTANERT